MGVWIGEAHTQQREVEREMHTHTYTRTHTYIHTYIHTFPLLQDLALYANDSHAARCADIIEKHYFKPSVAVCGLPNAPCACSAATMCWWQAVQRGSPSFACAPFLSLSFVPLDMAVGCRTRRHGTGCPHAHPSSTWPLCMASTGKHPLLST